MLERELAEQLGLKRAILSKIRKSSLVENRHYIRTDQGILLKGDGLDVMRQALESQVENAAPAPVPETAAAETPSATVPEIAPSAGNGPQKEVLAHLPEKIWAPG